MNALVGSRLFRAALFFFGGLASLPAAQGQTPCTPIPLSSIIIANTNCGNASGTIILDIGSGAYLFNWTPNVSFSNVAQNLSAGTYTVQVVRADDPTCTLDTTIIVNNSNGPATQASVTAANCLASNGSITLTPSTLAYTWSNGETGNVNTGLGSGCYFVTATNANGCYSVRKVCVPNINPLSSTAVVVKNAKCGLPTGLAEVVVTGGSGQYAYSLGDATPFPNLSAGLYQCAITDELTGCADTVNFEVESIPVNAAVQLSPNKVSCPGGNNGSVGIAVTPGDNFDLPFSTVIRDANGVQVGQNNLKAGLYSLLVRDADGCALPTTTFVIGEPPPFNAQALVSPENCLSGGQIQLGTSGGTGPKKVDWVDLPGPDNPANRSDLAAGIYTAIVYDSLFCSFTVPPILVPSNCGQIDTVPMLLSVNSTDTFCMALPVGLLPAQVNFELVGNAGGGNSGNSAYGSWVLQPDGCLIYAAGNTPGLGLDLICLARNTSQPGLGDTICVLVSITAAPPTAESVFFNVSVNSAGTACGNIPANFGNPSAQQLVRPGLSGASGAFGNYSINPVNACITFEANSLPGFAVDEIPVLIWDAVLNQAHIVTYVPTVTQLDCTVGALPIPGQINLPSTICPELTPTCIPIPYSDIGDYFVLQDGLPYGNGFLGCDLDTAIAYGIAILPPIGPYQLTEWTLNGQVYSGNFSSVGELTNLLNQWDPVPGWTVQDNFFLIGGSLANNYGQLKIVATPSGVFLDLQPTVQYIPRGTEMRFAEGEHTVIFRNLLSGCADTSTVVVTCFQCPQIHNYATNSSGQVSWQIADCDSDSLFCTNIPTAELANFSILDNGQPFVNTSVCGNFVALPLDSGFHHISIRNNISTCDYAVQVQVNCPSVAASDTIRLSVALGAATEACLNGGLIGGQFISLENECGQQLNGNIAYTLNVGTQCVRISGENPGADTLCLLLCNTAGGCMRTAVFVEVLDIPVDTTFAVDDQAYTPRGQALDVDIIGNDFIQGATGNLGALESVALLDNPDKGSASYDPATGILRYLPDPQRCGLDSIRYQIRDSVGLESEARIFITIICGKILIYNGISPNGDGLNDVWTLPGIEQYPNNEVRLYSRWGTEVFSRKGYANANAWDGRWNGRDLPDGTYFYLINFGDGSEALSGWVQLLR